MATFVKFNTFTEDLGKGVHQLHTAGHVLKVYLTNATPDVAADTVKADLAEITPENGYPSGGTAITNDYVETNGSGTLSGVDVAFTAAGGSFGPARYAVLYNDTPTSPADPLIGYWDLGSSITPVSGESIPVEVGGPILLIADPLCCGPLFPRTGTKIFNTPYDDQPWITPSLIKVADGLGTTTGLFNSPNKTYLLVATAFDFSELPGTATITGITVSFNAKKVGIYAPPDITLLQLIGADGSLMGENKYTTPETLVGTGGLDDGVYTIYTKGSSGDSWQSNLSPLVIKDPSFGVAIGLTATTVGCSAGVDYVTMTVHYIN